MSLAIIRFNWGHEHANAWQRPGAFQKSAPPLPAPASSPTAAVAEGHHHRSDSGAVCHQWHHCRAEHCLPRTGLGPCLVMRHGGPHRPQEGAPWPIMLSRLGTKTGNQTSGCQILALSAGTWPYTFTKARETKLGEEKHPCVLFYIYSFTHLLTHLLIHLFNYSLLNTVFGETGLLRFHLIKETTWTEIQTNYETIWQLL